MTKKLTNMLGNLCCARDHSVQFFVQFFTQLNWTVNLGCMGPLSLSSLKIGDKRHTVFTALIPAQLVKILSSLWGSRLLIVVFTRHSVWTIFRAG
jgi:hypothetical protein